MAAELPTHSQQIMTNLDTTAELDEEHTTYYQSKIDILHWIVELRMIDIATEVSLLASPVDSQERDTYRQYFIYMPT